jgi:taurine dioxygenase
MTPLATHVGPRFLGSIWRRHPADGWIEEESRSLLDYLYRYLYRHAVRPEFTCRFQWREGSLAFWDNRSTWHFAVNDYHGERRPLHRVPIESHQLA